MPDYMLCFAVVILTHLPLYESNKDVQVLEQLKSALWFILEPLMVKNENFSLQFYKMLLEMMKSHIDASEPPSEIVNHVRSISISNTPIVPITYTRANYIIANYMFFLENVGAL